MSDAHGGQGRIAFEHALRDFTGFVVLSDQPTHKSSHLKRLLAALLTHLFLELGPLVTHQKTSGQVLILLLAYTSL